MRKINNIYIFSLLLLLSVMSCRQSDVAQIEKEEDGEWRDRVREMAPLLSTNPDSLLLLLNTMLLDDELTDSKKATLYNFRGATYMQMLEFEASEANLWKSLYYFERLGDNYTTQAQVVRNIAVSRLRRGEFQSALDAFRQARTLIGNHQATELLFAVYMDKGSTFTGMGKIDSALYYIQAGIDIAENEDFKRGQALGMMNLATLFSNLGSVSQAENNIRRSIPIFIELGNNKRNLWLSYQALARILIEQDRVEESMSYIQKADKIAATIGLPQIAMAIYYAYKGQNYLKENDYRNSLAMLYQALEMRAKVQDVRVIAEIKNDIGLAYSRMGNLDKALSYVNEALRIAQENQIPRLKAEVHRNLAVIYAARGKMSSSLAAMRTKEVLRNELVTNESNRALHEMQARYEAELNQLMMAQKAKDIQQQRNIIISQAITFITILLLLVFIIFSQRNKMKDTTKIVQQYERLLGYEKKENAKRLNLNGVAKKQSDDLLHLFEVEKIYRQQRLNVEQVAERIGISTSRLSIMLNKEFQKPFSDFVNAYRIAEAREILKEQDEGGEYAHYTIQAVAGEVGFNNATSFYSAFKSIVGVTPTEYKEAVRGMKGMAS